ncbi:RNA-binding domain-containing protein [Backusella circina FSU 941]|nr:RNA-binding domain-containing protein [Backusella circina FSU 941]
MSRSPYRSSSRHRYRRCYSRSPSLRPYSRRSPPPHRRYRSRSPPIRRMNRPINRKARVYVGNLSLDVKWHHLKDFMRQAGEVIYADVMLLSNGRSKGCGIVEYRYPEDAKHAIHILHKVEFMGRPVFVREDREYDALPPLPSHKDEYETPDGYRLYVGNLPHSASWQDMKDLFRKAGRVLHTDVNTEPGSRRSNGTGTVIFGDSRTAHAAIDMFHGYEWQGSTLQVGEEVLSKVSTTDTQPETTSTTLPVSVPSPQSTSAIGTESIPPSMNQPIENTETLQYQQPNSKPDYTTSYANMYRYGQDAVLPMYNMSLVGGPGAHLPSQGQHQIFVNNLPFSTTWEDLIDLFRHVGPVVRSEILTMNGHPKGAGFVRFENTTTCEKAIEKFNRYLYGGRYLDISLDTRE